MGVKSGFEICHLIFKWTSEEDFRCNRKSWNWTKWVAVPAVLLPLSLSESRFLIWKFFSFSTFRFEDAPAAAQWLYIQRPFDHQPCHFLFHISCLLTLLGISLPFTTDSELLLGAIYASVHVWQIIVGKSNPLWVTFLPQMLRLRNYLEKPQRLQLRILN